jgi:hypothetical protein
MIHSGSGRCLAWVETDSGYRHVERRAQRFLNRRPQRTSKKAGSSEGAKESVERLAIKVAQYSRLTISYEVAGFRPLLQSGPRFNVEYPGFRKASTVG